MSVAGATDLLAGRYRLDQQVASGGLGEVWRATDTVLERPVAVKLLRAAVSADPHALARLRGEACHAGGLAHHNIARVYDYSEPGPAHSAFLVMEFVDGTSLAEVLADGPLAPARVIDVVAQCAAGLAAAHQAGLVHRDITPANILISTDGLVKLAGFGIAHTAAAAPGAATGPLLGTPVYLAPERVEGDRSTAAGDLYSLGVVAYQCLAGRVPFGGSAVEVALAHRLRPLPPLPPSVPAEVAALIGWLTAKDPDARPSSAEEVARHAGGLRDRMALGDTRDGRRAPPAPGSAAVPVTAGPTHPWDMPRVDVPRRRRRRLLLAAAAILSVLAAVLVISLPSQGTQRDAAATPPRSDLVQVDGQALRGRPVPAVRTLLRHLGLTVRVRWRPSDRLPPGRVLSVHPDGLVHSGTTVVVTVARAPAAAAGPSSAGAVGQPAPGHGRRGQARPARAAHRTPQPRPTANPSPTGSPGPTGSPSPTGSPPLTPSGSPPPTPSGGPTTGAPAPPPSP
jgi:eukaryotic-like serine/threonine-protein kinase